ncbi:hypothetical protein evm_013598 [Chilo suppressalis]|nr:hypothetical protein evm_013598 [Chilo suppressalis]
MLAVLLMHHMTTNSKTNGKKRPKSNKIEIQLEPLPTSDDPADAFCRTCLSKEDLVPIFSNKDAEKKRSQDLNSITGLWIRMGDGLSQKICRSCLNSLKAALQFRRTSRKAEKTLLDMPSKDKPKKKTKIRKREVKNAKVNVYDDCDDMFDAYMDLGSNDCQNESSYDNNYDFKTESYGESNDLTVPDIVTEDKDTNKNNAQPTVKKRQPEIPNAPSYDCPICHKQFNMKATYKAHLRFHTNYCICETCGKRCRNNIQMQEHKRARHGLGRIHKCAYCEYSSATKEALTIHERRHTGERPYVCDHCGATFHRRSNLVQHIAIHNPDKNFQCDLCPKRLKSRKFLQIHKHNAHTGRKYGYLCPVCDHRFEKPNKVRAHTRRVHGMQDHEHPPIVRVLL